MAASILAREKGERWQQALGMLSNMQHWQVEPDEISYSAALSACEKPLQWQQALGILSAMQHLQRLEPNAINACETGEQWQHEDAVGDSARA